jgi:hypothetical protein
LDDLRFNPQDNLPADLESELWLCWRGKYAELDLEGQDDFIHAARRLITAFLSSVGDRSERALLVFFISLAERAEMWLLLERPDNPDPARAIAAAKACLTSNCVISAEEADCILPPQKRQSGNLAADEAYLVLRYLVRCLDPAQLRELAPSFLDHAVMSHGIVIPEGQRRLVLRWCLEEGLPAAFSNRKSRSLSAYLYDL